MLYGWAIIPLMYLFSFVFRTASTAFVVLTMFNVITGLACLLTVFILSIPGNLSFLKIFLVNERLKTNWDQNGGNWYDGAEVLARSAVEC